MNHHGIIINSNKLLILGNVDLPQVEIEEGVLQPYCPPTCLASSTNPVSNYLGIYDMDYPDRSSLSAISSYDMTRRYVEFSPVNYCDKPAIRRGCVGNFCVKWILDDSTAPQDVLDYRAGRDTDGAKAVTMLLRQCDLELAKT